MTILETIKLTKHFGALKAVDDVSLRIAEKTIHSIIGPNGAGKTTLFNMLAGVAVPSSGRILFSGEDITNFKVFERSQKGIGRSYQVTSIFPDLTIMENIRLAAQSRTRTFNIFKNANRLEQTISTAMNIVEDLGLGKIAHKKASSVSYGYQRFLEVGIALATSPSLLLLDEPTSGLPPDEALRLAKLIKQISKGLTILLVEHHMKVVMSISDYISVFQQGRVIAEGSPKEIQESEIVRRAYLGGSKDANC